MVINLRRYRRLHADAKGRIWASGMLARDKKAMMRYRAFLNGEDVTDRTFYVDSRRGIVRMHINDADGHALLAESGDEVAWEERRGHVRLVQRKVPL